jgi:hypothetical protein
MRIIAPLARAIIALSNNISMETTIKWRERCGVINCNHCG